MAIWVILYGFVQGMAPKLIRQSKKTAATLAMQLAIIPMGIASLILLFETNQTWIVIVGLLVFGAVFALNSSLHSFLILQFSDAKRVTMDVGFYYMANAAGRLIGTVLSGVVYQFAGLQACLLVSSIMLFVTWWAMNKLSAYD